MLSDYPVDTKQTLAAWLEEWAIMEAARIKRLQADFPRWLTVQDTYKWKEITHAQWARILAPFKEGKND